MVILISCGLILLLLLLLLLFMKIKLEIQVIITTNENSITIKINTLYGLVRFKKKFTFADLTSLQKEVQEEAEGNFANFSAKKWMNKEHLKPYQQMMKTMMKIINIRTFNWKSMIGVGDAASTGVVVGVVWSLKEIVMTFMRKQLQFQQPPEIHVISNFQQYTFQTNLQCMLYIKAGNAMLAGIKIMKLWKKKQQEMAQPNNIQESRRTVNG